MWPTDEQETQPRPGQQIRTSILHRSPLAPELAFWTSIGCTLELGSKQLQLCKNAWRLRFAEGGNSKHTKKNNAQSKNSARIFWVVCLPRTLWWFGAMEVLVLLLVAMHRHPTKSCKWPCLATYRWWWRLSSDHLRPVRVITVASNLLNAKAKSKEPPCLGCTTLHSRDFNAAHVIADMFLAMQATNSSELPDWITVDAIRQSNLLIPLAV